MNLNNILKRLITAEDRKELHEYVFNMLLHNTDTAVLEYCIHAITENKKPIRIDKGDDIWFNPIDNMYDLKDLYEEDRLIDANLLNNLNKGTAVPSLLRGKIISDTNYQQGCNAYAAEYKVKAYISVDDSKEIRVKRENIWGIVEPEDLV